MLDLLVIGAACRGAYEHRLAAPEANAVARGALRFAAALWLIWFVLTTW